MHISHIYYEKNILNYDLGKYLLEKYKNVPKTVIENHNNIKELREKENKDFPILKTYLIIGIRKTQNFVLNYKVSNYLVPYTSSGCGAMCLYCYLVCNFNKCSYLRVFVNKEELLSKIIKHSIKSKEEMVYEIGSNSDLVYENMITNNLKWTIEEFGKINKGYLTFPTKFHQIDDIIGIKHNKRTIIRVSVNPEEIINNIELKTSSLDKRIEAINRLCDDNYKVGILIAPVIMVNNYKKLYKELIITLKNKLSEKVKKEVFFEVIFMTYSYVNNVINKEAFPNLINLYDKNIQTGRGKGKYVYKPSLKEEGKTYIEELLNVYFPNNIIKYIC